MNKKNLSLASYIEAKRDIFIDVNDKIWEYAETRFEEYKSAELLCKVLEEEGFKVEKGVADMETAFVASYGSGKPVIGILGEYDALSKMSQKDGITKKEPLIEGASGHGCGHHALGAGALAAVVGIKDYMTENNIQGTIRYYGCPGEEGGNGKTFMVREGFFDDVDTALSWHPLPLNIIFATSTLANIQVYFKFKGITAHAASTPHLGRSALDAVELMNVGVNYLREHIISEARVHYAVTDTGGNAPNVVQANAEALYLVRAPKITQANEIYQRICKIAEGAALMTETQLEVVFDTATANAIPNTTIENLMHQVFEEFGPVPIDEEDIQYAEKIRKTLTPEERTYDNMLLNVIAGIYAPQAIKNKDGKSVEDMVVQHEGKKTIPGSSDCGDVSWKVPFAACATACCAADTANHSWQMVAQGKSQLMHKGMLHAGKIIAASAIKIFESPEIVEQAKAELKEKKGADVYVCPIPPEVKPSAKK